MRKLLQHPRWPLIKKWLGGLFLLIVLVLLVRYARTVDWVRVKESMLELPRTVLLQALGFAVFAHLVYSLMDLIGRRYTGHHMSKREVMQVSFISFAFNLNLGSLVGGVGLRYRLYSNHDVRPGIITRILSMALITNWFGYITLAGLVFLLAPIELPPQFKLDGEELRMIGVVLLGVAVTYLGLCGLSRRRSFIVRGHEVNLPSFRLALAQLALSASHWLSLAAVPWTLLNGAAD